MLKVFFWLRYLRKKKIVLLCIMAVALSVALLLVVDNLFTGLIDGLKKSLAAEDGNFSIFTYGRPFKDYDVLVNQLEQLKGTEAAAPVSFGGGLLWLETGNVRETEIQGIDIKSDLKFTNWAQKLIRTENSSKEVTFDAPGFPDANGAWVGVALIAEPNEKTDKYDLGELRQMLGKKIVLTTEQAGGKRKVIPLRIAGIVCTDTIRGDRAIYLPFESLFKIQSGIEKGGYANIIKIKTHKNIDRASYQQLVSDTWQSFAKNQLGWEADDIARLGFEWNLGSQFFDELYKQMAILFLIFGVICSVVVLLVFCIFFMIVETKIKDIAILKSFGSGDAAIVWIFTGFGGCIGLVGSAAGVAIGFIITKNLNLIEQWIHIVTGIKLWLRSSYFLNYIPNQMNWSDVPPVVIAAVVACCVGALIPAIVAAKTKPVEILSYE